MTTLCLTTQKNANTKTDSTGISERMEPNEPQNTRTDNRATERNQNELQFLFQKRYQYYLTNKLNYAEYRTRM